MTDEYGRTTPAITRTFVLDNGTDYGKMGITYPNQQIIFVVPNDTQNFLMNADDGNAWIEANLSGSCELQVDQPSQQG